MVGCLSNSREDWGFVRNDIENTCVIQKLQGIILIL